MDAMTDSATPPARLDVGIVGAGRVGAVLGAALARSGHRVVAASAVSLRSRTRVASLLPDADIRRPPEVFAVADLVLLAVPEPVLSELVDGLVRTGSVRPGQLVAHTCGRYGTAVLAPAVGVGALPMALHPALSFTGTGVDVQRLGDASFGVTAPDPVWPIAAALVVEMGGDPVRIAEEHRTTYDAAITHGARHVVAMLGDAIDLLHDAGVEHPERMLEPLLSAASDHVMRSGDDALAGPTADGDAAAVAEHLEAWSARRPEAVAAYRVLARRTAERALASGRLRPEQAESLLDVLADGPRA